MGGRGFEKMGKERGEIEVGWGFLCVQLDTWRNDYRCRFPKHLRRQSSSGSILTAGE